MRLDRGLLFAAAVGAFGLAAPAVQAHFLQTDPVGYKDNMDLYAYVGDDPVNHTDPLGLSCRGGADNGTCQIDGTVDKASQDWMNKHPDAVKAAEATMTRAYRDLMRDPGRQSVMKGSDGKPLRGPDGRPVVISNGDIARSMAGRGVFVDINRTTFSRSQDRADAGTEFGGRRTYLPRVYFTEGPMAQATAFTHEMIHGRIAFAHDLDEYAPQHEREFDGVVRNALSPF